MVHLGLLRIFEGLARVCLTGVLQGLFRVGLWFLLGVASFGVGLGNIWD